MAVFFLSNLVSCMEQKFSRIFWDLPNCILKYDMDNPSSNFKLNQTEAHILISLWGKSLVGVKEKTTYLIFLNIFLISEYLFVLIVLLPTHYCALYCQYCSLSNWQMFFPLLQNWGKWKSWDNVWDIFHIPRIMGCNA